MSRPNGLPTRVDLGVSGADVDVATSLPSSRSMSAPRFAAARTSSSAARRAFFRPSAILPVLGNSFDIHRRDGGHGLPLRECCCPVGVLLARHFVRLAFVVDPAGHRSGVLAVPLGRAPLVLSCLRGADGVQAQSQQTPR